MKINAIKNIPEIVTKNLENKRIFEFTDVQSRVFPVLISKKNLIAVAPTGSGKTLCYLLTAIMNLDISKKIVQTVILVPTRELVSQISKEAKSLTQGMDIKIGTSVGGTGFESVQDEKNLPQILIGTPSFLKKMLENGIINLTTADAYIIDEADTMLDLGFSRDISDIITRGKKNANVFAFSATLSQELQQELQKMIFQPIFINIKESVSRGKITHHAVIFERQNILDSAINLIKTLSPYRALIFSNTSQEAELLYNKLIETTTIKVCLIHGKTEMRERQHILKRIALGEFQYIVTTDLLARGLNIEALSHVISLQLPNDIIWYVHRSGRLARTPGTIGDSYVLIDEKQISWLEKLRKYQITFSFFFIKRDGSLKESKDRIGHKKSKNRKITLQEVEIRKLIKTTSKKVKPNYRKDLKRNIEKIKQKHKRSRIEEDVKRVLVSKWKKESAKKREFSKNNEENTKKYK